MLSQESKLNLVNTNIDRYWELMGHVEGFDVIKEPKLVRCESSQKSQHPIFNSVLRSYFTENETRDAIQETIAHFEPQDQQFTWLVDPSQSPANLRTMLFRHGFENAESYTCKILNLSDYQEQATDQELIQFAWVESAKDLDAWMIPQIEVKGFDKFAAEQYKRIRLNLMQNMDNYHFLIGFRNQEPVYAATLFVEDGIAGLYNACTVRAARSCGYGTNAVVFRLNEAKRLGCTHAITETNRFSNSITADVGFQPLVTYQELCYGRH